MEIKLVWNGVEFIFAADKGQMMTMMMLSVFTL